MGEEQILSFVGLRAKKILNKKTAAHLDGAEILVVRTERREKKKKEKKIEEKRCKRVCVGV